MRACVRLLPLSSESSAFPSTILTRVDQIKDVENVRPKGRSKRHSEELDNIEVGRDGKHT
jgi:hypothetical protein